MATSSNYIKIGELGLWGLDAFAAAPLTQGQAIFGLLLNSVNASADADQKDLKDANGITVAQVAYNSKASISFEGAVASTVTIPRVGEVLTFSAANLSKIPDLTIGATGNITKAFVTKSEIKGVNEDFVTISVEAVYNPSLTYPSTSGASQPA